MLLNELATLLRDVLLYLTAPDGCARLLSGNFNTDTIHGFTGALRPAMLMRHLDTVQNAQEKLKDSRNQRMTVELCLISMCDPTLHDDMAGLRARIEELELKLANARPVAAPSVGIAEEDLPPWDEPVPAPPPAPKKQEQPAPKKRRQTYEEMMGLAPAPTPAPKVLDDRPPWDEEPPPFMDDYDRPPLPEEPPVFEEPAPAPAPKKKEQPAPTGTGPDPNWLPFIDLAKSKLPPFVSNLLHQCSGTFTDDGMVLYAPTFPYGQMNTPANLQKLKQCVNDFYGRPVDFKLESAASNAPRPAARSLDEFRNDKFSDIVKFK